VRGLPVDSSFPERPEEPRFSLDDVRKLQITYNRHRSGAATCFVEYVGGRIEVFEADRFLIERLLEHLKHRDS
jgi:hypothetical protein